VGRTDIDTRIDRGVAVVMPRGELDIAGVPLMHDALAALEQEPHVHAVLLDLSGIEFIDSSGLRAIMRAERAVARTGRRFALVKGGQPVHRVFELTGMESRLTWVGSAADLVDGGEQRA
jgi:anti-sigma B factor antagonist